MKKLLFLTLFCGCCFSAVAQQQESADWKSQGRHQVSVGMGISPWEKNKEMVGGYQNTGRHPIGFSVAYQYRVDRVVDVGVVYGLTTKKKETSLDKGHSKYRETRHSVLLFGRFNYFQWKSGVLYGRLGAGLRIEAAKDELVYDGNKQKMRGEEDIAFAFQLSPIGVEVGRKLAGFAEFGYGSIGTAIVGMRYRF